MMIERNMTIPTRSGDLAVLIENMTCDWTVEGALAQGGRMWLMACLKNVPEITSGAPVEKLVRATRRRARRSVPLGQ
jgi:hypothetical protein